METFIKNVKKCLESYGWSQSTLAEEASISRPNLNRILNGHENCTTTRLERIARALEVSLSDLFDENFKLEETAA